MREKELLDKNHLWWTNQVEILLAKLNKVKVNAPFSQAEIDKLESNISLFQKRGEIEQKIYEDFQQKHHNIIFGSLFSGFAGIKLR